MFGTQGQFLRTTVLEDPPPNPTTVVKDPLIPCVPFQASKIDWRQPRKISWRQPRKISLR